MDQLFQGYDHLTSINRDNLRQILRDNVGTVYGRKYGFGEISSIEEFREKVPLSDNSAYEKTGTVSAYPCAYVLHTSGTTGKTKTIYLTEESLRRYSGYVYLMPMHLAGIEPEYLIHVNMFRIHPEESILNCTPFVKQHDILSEVSPKVRQYFEANTVHTAVLTDFLTISRGRVARRLRDKSSIMAAMPKESAAQPAAGARIIRSRDLS